MNLKSNLISYLCATYFNVKKMKLSKKILLLFVMVGVMMAASSCSRGSGCPMSTQVHNYNHR